MIFLLPAEKSVFTFAERLWVEEVEEVEEVDEVDEVEEVEEVEEVDEEDKVGIHTLTFAET